MTWLHDGAYCARFFIVPYDHQWWIRANERTCRYCGEIWRRLCVNPGLLGHGNLLALYRIDVWLLEFFKLYSYEGCEFLGSVIKAIKTAIKAIFVLCRPPWHRWKRPLVLTSLTTILKSYNQINSYHPNKLNLIDYLSVFLQGITLVLQVSAFSCWTVVWTRRSVRVSWSALQTLWYDLARCISGIYGKICHLVFMARMSQERHLALVSITLHDPPCTCHPIGSPGSHRQSRSKMCLHFHQIRAQDVRYSTG